MLIQDRTYSPDTNSYRFGFQEQEKDDELNGEGNIYFYKYRVHDVRVNRFFSIDPLTRQYPHNSPYAFSENRPIDGIEFEGLEYLSFHIAVYNKERPVFLMVYDYRGIEELRKEGYSESFGPEGRGIKYTYHYYNEAGEYVTSVSEMYFTQDDILSGIGKHGMYMGSGCITAYGPKFDVSTPDNWYDFTFSPIDEVDLAAKVHDIAAANIPGYIGWLEDNRTLESDKELVQAFHKYVEDHTMVVDPVNNTTIIAGVDKVTGRIASAEAYQNAKNGARFFDMVIRYKEWKIEKLVDMGLDPYDPANFDKVSLEDYKGKWYQLKRNIEYKILKEAKAETSNADSNEE